MGYLRAYGRYLLGLFVLAQLAFIPLGNLTNVENALRHTARRQEALPEWTAGDDGLDVRLKSVVQTATWWGRLTGQEQPWQLFAPDTISFICFPVIELRWANGEVVVLPSENRPADRHAFFRFSGFRQRRAETAFDVAPHDEVAVFDAFAPAWAETIRQRTWFDRPGYLAYLRWRVQRHLDTSPGLTWPDEVFLSTELWRVPPPPGPSPWDWVALGTYPVLRLRSKAPGDPRNATIHLFAPLSGSYDELLWP